MDGRVSTPRCMYRAMVTVVISAMLDSVVAGAVSVCGAGAEVRRRATAGWPTGTPARARGTAEPVLPANINTGSWRAINKYHKPNYVLLNRRSLILPGLIHLTLGRFNLPTHSVVRHKRYDVFSSSLHSTVMGDVRFLFYAETHVAIIAWRNIKNPEYKKFSVKPCKTHE